MKIKYPKILLFFYYMVGPLLTLFACLTHFLFAPNQMIASIIWAIACGLFFYAQCFLSAKLDNEIKKSFKIFFLCLLVLFIVTFIFVLIINWDASFINLLKETIFYSLYWSSSIFSWIFLLVKLSIFKTKKNEINQKE